MNNEQHPFETLSDQDSENPHFTGQATQVGNFVFQLPVINPNYKRDADLVGDDPYDVTSID